MKKDAVVVILLLVAVALAAVLAHFAQKASRADKSLEEERYGRLVAEETLQKGAAKLVALENQVKTAADKMAKVQDLVDQEKGVNADLKKQYAKLAEAKEELEARLKAALQEQAAVQAQVQPAAQPQQQTAAAPAQ